MMEDFCKFGKLSGFCTGDTAQRRLESCTKKYLRNSETFKLQYNDVTLYYCEVLHLAARQLHSAPESVGVA